MPSTPTPPVDALPSVRWLQPPELNLGRVHAVLRASLPRMLTIRPYTVHGALVVGDYDGVLIAHRPRLVWSRVALAGLIVLLIAPPAGWWGGMLPVWVPLAIVVVMTGTFGAVMAVGGCPVRETVARALLGGRVDWIAVAIAVHPALRGRGYGRALVQAAHDHLRARDERALLIARRGLEDWYLQQGARRAWRQVPRILLLPA